jgi:hypothetical protein
MSGLTQEKRLELIRQVRLAQVALESATQALKAIQPEINIMSVKQKTMDQQLKDQLLDLTDLSNRVVELKACLVFDWRRADGLLNRLRWLLTGRL